jgi:molecular chaperone HtpG
LAGISGKSETAAPSVDSLVADEGDMDMHLERMLKQHRQLDAGFKRVLEVNPRHSLMVGLAKRVSEKGSVEEVAEASWLLLDQARIVGGEPYPTRRRSRSASPT